jgi:glycosyltransferase involved in cell wall biosynthesis
MMDNRSSLKIIHVAPCMQDALGGPPQVVAALTQSLARFGCRVETCTVDWGSRFGKFMPIDPSLVKLNIVQGRVWKYPRMWLAKGFRRCLLESSVGADVIHVDGCWISPTNDAAIVATERKIPRIISLHGELAKISLRRSAWKKAIIRRLYADRNLRTAACLHALTDQEIEEIRSFGLRNPLAVIPNGVDLETFNDLPPRRAADERWPDLKDKKIILYLSRISPIKGPQFLVKVWCRLARRYQSWHLVIAGPDEFGLQTELETMTRNAGSRDTVTFTGPTYGRDKLVLMGAADVFALPSTMEGFSMAILEAMACRLPVLITPQCNFDEAVNSGAGILTNPDPDNLECSLAELMNASDAQRREMGLRGRKLVEEKYTWDHVAEQTADIYRWLAGGGPAPTCIQY